MKPNLRVDRRTLVGARSAGVLGACLVAIGLFAAGVPNDAAPAGPAQQPRNADAGALPAATAAACPARRESDDAASHCLSARVIAVGLQSVHGVRQVGMFHAGGPIPGNPAFLMQTRPGKMLDPTRLLVATGSNFGAPPADAQHALGAVLSIDPNASSVLDVPPRFAAAGGQAESAQGAIKLYSAQSGAFTNAHYNRGSLTAALTAAAGPRYISINNAFGRPWIANSPFGAAGAGSSTVVDPDGRPLDNAPSPRAGGVFAGAMTARHQVLVHEGRSGVAARALDYRASAQLTPGQLASGALGTAFLGASPDGSGFAVFAVATADGAVAQVHVQDGVDGLAPAGTLQPAAAGTQPTVVGMAFKWNADRALFLADAGRNRIAVLHLSDDRRHFTVTRTSELRAGALREPIDIAAAIPEVANPRFASHTTLAAGADLYVANRGDGSLLRIAQDGRVLARARVHVAGLGAIGGGRLRAMAVSADASRLWLTLEGDVPSHPGREGVLIEVSAFDAGAPFDRVADRSRSEAPTNATSNDARAQGELAFRKEYGHAEGLGPAFNARSCVACHSEPSVGGMSSDESKFVLRVARVHPATGRLEPLAAGAGPVARMHALPGTLAGIPRDANVTSLRMPMALYEAARIERITDDAILAHAIAKGDGIRGRPNRVQGSDGKTRIGRFGWKADVASLDEMVATAFDNELGITSARGPHDAAADDDGSLVRTVGAYLRGLETPPRPAAIGR
jgi:hypothetical protein